MNWRREKVMGPSLGARVDGRIGRSAMKGSSSELRPDDISDHVAVTNMLIGQWVVGSLEGRGGTCYQTPRRARKFRESMIPKSGYRFSDKIMLEQQFMTRADNGKVHGG
jgi:hypothetical protein